MALHAVIMLLSVMLRQTSTETDNHSLGVPWSLPPSHGILDHDSQTLQLGIEVSLD